MQIAFNVRYLLDGLKAMGSDRIVLHCNAPTTPAVLRSEEASEAFTYLVMPCLLYTSPSPRDAHESRMPSSA